MVQYCIDLDIPFGFVLTNAELIIFHLVKTESKNEGELERNIVTRMSRPDGLELQFLSSDATEEPDFSTPLRRNIGDWVEFDEGDDDIPLLTWGENRLGIPLESTPPDRGGGELLNLEMSGVLLSQADEPGHTTPEPLNSSQQSSMHPDSSPCPPGRMNRTHATPEPPSSSQQLSMHLDSIPCPPGSRSRKNRTPTMSPSISSSVPQTGSQGYAPDFRGEDPTHVLIKAYPADGEEVAQRLFELCMLSKAAKDNDALRIWPKKLSFESFPPQMLHDAISPQ